MLAGNDLICNNCVKEVAIIREPKCQKCGKPLENGDTIYCKGCSENMHFFEKGVAVFMYQGALKESLYRFKYNNFREYADFYGAIAAKIYGKTFQKWKIQSVIPVPLYRNKEIRRGYNQAEVFAKSVSRCTKIPLEHKSLIRIKNTAPQKELSAQMRKANLSEAFAVDMGKVSRYKNVLLVDDIYTTGSTIDACAKLLLAAGVEKVYFLCISCGPDIKKYT